MKLGRISGESGPRGPVLPYRKAHSVAALTTSQQLALATRKTSRSQQLAEQHSAVPGLSNEDVKKMLEVFKSEGILLNIDGVDKFRTMEDLVNPGPSAASVDLGKAFESALKELETRGTNLCKYYTLNINFYVY